MTYIGKQPLPKYDFEDQGQFGTCEGNGIAHQLEYHALDAFPGQQIMFSRLWIYYWSKVLEGNWDEGTNPEYGYKQLMDKGVCLETDYPYSLLKDVKNIPSPSADAVKKALQFKIKSYTALDPNCKAIDKAIDDGYVVNVGTIVTENFVEAPEGGYIGMAEGTILGGHDYVIIGRDDEMTHAFSDGTSLKGFYLLVNSWAEQQYAWVAKAFIAGATNDGSHTPILEGAWIVDTGWTNGSPAPQEDIELWIGKTDAMVNGKLITLDVAPQFTNDHMTVEVRPIFEALGYKVSWDAANNKAIITK